MYNTCTIHLVFSVAVVISVNKTYHVGICSLTPSSINLAQHVRPSNSLKGVQLG